MKPRPSSTWMEKVVLIGCAAAFVVALTLAVRTADGGWASGGIAETRASSEADSQSLGRSTLGDDDPPQVRNIDEPVQLRIRSPEAAPALTNDSNGPLFIETNMAPGTTSTRCVSVTNVGLQVAEVRLFAAIADKGLARHITFLIESAPGEDADCSSIAGTEIYRGSLAELATRHHDYGSGVVAPRLVHPKGSVRFRLTQRLDETSPQGVSARVRFGWEARSAGLPSPLREGRDPLPGADPAPIVERGAHRSVAALVLNGAREVVERGWTWFLLLVLVVAFLVVQDRIDRRDPRLAGARIHPEPDLPFSERIGRSTLPSEATL